MSDIPATGKSETDPAVDPGDARAALQTFTACVFDPADLVEVRILNGVEAETKRKWLPARELPRLAAALARLNAEGRNVYAGANPRRGRGGKAAHVKAARCVFADFDGTTAEEALGRIAAAGLPAPTLALWSGHGVHAYWRLAAPLELPPAAEKDAWAAAEGRWRGVQERLILALGADDKIKDLPRIMRLPGFVNHKGGRPPAPAHVLDADPSRRHPLELFEQLLPPPGKPAWHAGHDPRPARGLAAPAPADARQARLQRYARQALARQAGNVAAAREPGRNSQLNASAYTLGRLLAGLDREGAGHVLDRRTVEEELAEAARRCGLEAGETAKTIRSGLDAGLADPRDLSGVGRVGKREGQPRGKAAPPPDPPPAGKAAPPGGQTGVRIILDYYRERYRPVFKRGGVVHCEDGRAVTMTEATKVPTSALITRLESATDAPKVSASNPAVSREKLPSFFKRWADTAWGDLLDTLKEEEAAAVGKDTVTAQQFRQAVIEVLLAQVQLGVQDKETKQYHPETRSLIHWAKLCAKPGDFQPLRSYQIWFKTVEPTPGEVQTVVAIRRHLFAQVKADPRLRALTETSFARLARRYGVGASTEAHRPQGRRAVVLDRDLVADLLAGCPEATAEAG